MRFLVVDREQRLVERVHVGRDVDGAGHEHAATEQQVRHGAHAKAPQALFAAHQRRSPSRVSRNACKRLVREAGIGADVRQHRDIADVGAALEIGTENRGRDIGVAAFVDSQLHQAMRLRSTRQCAKLFEMEIEAKLAPASVRLFSANGTLMPAGKRSAR